MNIVIKLMKKLLLVSLLALGTAFSTTGHAQMGQISLRGSYAYETAARPLRGAAPRQYNFSKAVLSDIMRLMAEDAGIGFFGLPETANSQDRVVTFTINASPFAALETLAKANGISLIYDSGIWYLRPANDGELIGRIYQINYNAQELVRKNGSSADLGSSQGSGQSGAGGGGLSLQGSPDFFITEPSKLLEDIRGIIDIPTTGSIATIAPTASVNNGQFSLSNFQGQPTLGQPNIPQANVGGTVGVAQSAGSQAAGNGSKVIWNSDSNSLYVVATRQQHLWIEAYLASADKPQPMVAIEVKFLEMSKDPSSEIGVDWTGVLGEDGLGATLSNASGPINLANIGSYSLPTAVLSYNDLNLTLRSLYQDRRTKSVSYPRMVTLDNREVSFRSVVNQPVLGSSASTSLGAGATQTSSVEYIPIGTVINILPKIMADCKVLLNVSVTVSDIIGTEFINGNPFPIATSRVYTAPLTVASGYTVAISGLDAARTENNERGVPVLGKLPLVGGAFKTRNKDRSRQHLMMLITPVVINSHCTGVPKAPMSRDPNVSYPIHASAKAQICNTGCDSKMPPLPPQNPERPRTQHIPEPQFTNAGSMKKSNQTFGSKPEPAVVARPLPEAKVEDKGLGASGNVAEAVSSDPAPAAAPAPPAAPENDAKLSDIKDQLDSLQGKLKALPAGDAKLTSEQGKTAKAIYDESRTLLTEIDGMRADSSKPLQGELGDVWWSIIQLKTDAGKFEERLPDGLAINFDE